MEIRRCKSGFVAVRVHYSDDPEAWTEERILKIRAALPGWRWQKEYEIDFNARGGQKVFDCFDPIVHVRPLDYDFSSYPRYKSIDHGRRNPTAVLWWLEDKKTKTLYFYREYYRPNATIAENARAILALEKEGPTRLSLIDPSTHRRLDNSVSTIADEYAQYGIKTVPADNNISSGIEQIYSALISSLARWSVENGTLHRYFEEHLIPGQRLALLAKERAVYFHPSMVNTVRELTEMSWDESACDDDPLSERFSSGDDHCIDCLRYALLRPRLRKKGLKAVNIKTHSIRGFR